MGFDIYGLKPKLKSKQPIIDWDKNPSKEETSKYFEAREKFNQTNKGYYFRNNVWWWRPLADYVLEVTEGMFTDDEKAEWHNNGGFEVSEKQALTIANLLEESVKIGITKGLEQKYSKEMKKAEKNNKILQGKLDELKKIVIDKTGKKDIVPINYPEPFNSQWNDINKMTDWKAHYPFKEDNVKEFIMFCRESGGFEIC